MPTPSQKWHDANIDERLLKLLAVSKQPQSDVAPEPQLSRLASDRTEGQPRWVGFAGRPNAQIRGLEPTRKLLNYAWHYARTAGASARHEQPLHAAHLHAAPSRV